MNLGGVDHEQDHHRSRTHGARTEGGSRADNLRDCGLTASQAIGLFYRQVVLERGMPFPIRSFNEETRRVLRQSEDGIDVQQFESAEALFEDLGI